MENSISDTRSSEIGKLALALSQAQGEITGAQKNKKNPFFKSDYADLASCWDACRQPLAAHKLAVIQTTKQADNGVIVVTTLVHESGQWMAGELFLKPVKNDPQGLGSALTYGRRYALSAIVGLAQSDDDGNEATHRKQENKQPVKKYNSGDIIQMLDVANDAAGLTKIYQANVNIIDSMPAVEKEKVVGYCREMKKVYEEQNVSKFHSDI